MGISICIVSGKGGTGKTSLAANLGVALRELGKDVTILDADIEMANLGLLFGLEDMKTTLHNVLAGEASVKDAVYQGAAGVKVVPTGISLRGLIKADSDVLGKVVAELLETTNILLIDVPPGLGKSAITALASAQQAMLVINPEISSMSDALKTKMVAEKLGSYVLGGVLNRATFDRTDLSVQEMETVLDTKILGVIPEDPEMRRSAAFGEPMVLRRPDSPASIAIKKLAADLIGEEYIPLKKESPIRRMVKGLVRDRH